MKMKRILFFPLFLWKLDSIICGAFEEKITDESLLDFDQYDERLSKALREKILNSPSRPEDPYNFSRPIQRINLHGQYEQPQIINREIFKNRVKNGFFIEAGAYDGEAYSNTLYYELKHNWTGILIEPNPDAFEELKMKHRKSWLLGHCLSTKNHSEIVDFDASGLLGGIIHQGKS